MPELLTTMIGSLPFDSIDEAVEYSLAHDIPAVPELPKLDGDMFSCLKRGRMPAAYEWFCLEAARKGVKKVKIQGAGPVTLMVHGGISENEAVNKIQDYIKSLLSCLTFADTIYVCFDEPAIGIFDPLDRLYSNVNRLYPNVIRRTMGAVFSSKGLIPMIHSCNDVSDRIGYFDDMSFKVVSFDATKYNVKYAGGSLRAEYWKFREKGGVLCFGAVSIMEGFGVSQFSPSDAREGDMISHSCGFGDLSADDCYRGRRILQDVKHALR